MNVRSTDRSLRWRHVSRHKLTDLHISSLPSYVTKKSRSLHRWFDDLRCPSFDWLQVEITSHCNASCDYCPHCGYRDSWQGQHMTLATFHNLLPVFRKTALVYLQGWGEPLLHPHFFKMVSLAKERGCRLGTTSNGTLWDSYVCEQVVQHGLDIVAFSLAGTNDRQDSMRCGTSFKSVLESIRSLDLAKKKLGSTQPAVHIAYMVLRSGLEEVATLPFLLEGLGVTHVVLSTLDLVTDPRLLAETLQPKDEKEEHYIRSYLKDAVERGKKLGIEMHFRVASPDQERGMCTENVLNAAFVSARGEVSPCAYTSLPAAQRVSLATFQKQEITPRLTFGNVNERSLSTIWGSTGYRAFRHRHDTGNHHSPCLDCPKLLMG